MNSKKPRSFAGPGGSGFVSDQDVTITPVICCLAAVLVAVSRLRGRELSFGFFSVVCSLYARGHYPLNSNSAPTKGQGSLISNAN